MVYLISVMFITRWNGIAKDNQVIFENGWFGFIMQMPPEEGNIILLN